MDCSDFLSGRVTPCIIPSLCRLGLATAVKSQGEYAIGITIKIMTVLGCSGTDTLAGVTTRASLAR